MRIIRIRKEKYGVDELAAAIANTDLATTAEVLEKLGLHMSLMGSNSMRVGETLRQAARDLREDITQPYFRLPTRSMKEE